MKLEGKVVVITGASKGLGLELAKAFAHRGAQLFLSARNEDSLSKVARELKAAYMVMDVSNEKQVAALANLALSRAGRIDIWINNAGIWLPHASAEDMDMKRVHEMVEVNLFGTIYGSREALRQMKKQKSGFIVNIISSSGFEGRAGSSGYAATKFGASGFTKSIRLEAEPFNIKVVGVYPGGMKTGIFDEKQPVNYSEFMKTDHVAEKIIQNLEREKPEEEQVIRR